MKCPPRPIESGILAVFRNNDPNLINPRNRHLFGKLHQNIHHPQGVRGYITIS
jgi:hypothetical protein